MCVGMGATWLSIRKCSGGGGGEEAEAAAVHTLRPPLQVIQTAEF